MNPIQCGICHAYHIPRKGITKVIMTNEVTYINTWMICDDCKDKLLKFIKDTGVHECLSR